MRSTLKLNLTSDLLCSYNYLIIEFATAAYHRAKFTTNALRVKYNNGFYDGLTARGRYSWQLDAAVILGILRQPQGNRLEELHSDLTDQWAMVHLLRVDIEWPAEVEIIDFTIKRIC